MGKFPLLVAMVLINRINGISVLLNGSNDLETSTGTESSNYIPLPFYPVQANIRGVPQHGAGPIFAIPTKNLQILPPFQKISVTDVASNQHNPLVGAVLLAAALGIPDKPIGYNHPELLPPNPYVALLLSHYGRYIAIPGVGRGLYGYGAVNNYHNNKPFGAYKIYEDNDS